MIPAVVETSEASIDEIKFHNNFFNVAKFSKEWKIWPKTHFLVFALLVEIFQIKNHYNLLQSLRTLCFWYFCPKWLFPELFVLKVDLCIKVVALIKIIFVGIFMACKGSILGFMQSPNLLPHKCRLSNYVSSLFESEVFPRAELFWAAISYGILLSTVSIQFLSKQISRVFSQAIS